MTIRNELLESTIFESEVLSKSRTRVVSLTQAELSTAEGIRFYTEYDKVFSTGETVYLLYQMPAIESGFVVALQERRFKSLSGEAEVEILWDSTGVTPGTPLPSFNENRNSVNTSNMITSVIATPTTDGTVRETDFLTGSGAGSNSSGDISPDSGSRIYSPSSFFIAKVTNNHNADNRIHLSYTHAEIALTNFA